MSSDLDARLKEIEAREQAATPGPWHEAGGDVRDEHDRTLAEMLCEWLWHPNAGQRLDKDVEADANFIAAARADIPFLIGEVRRLQREAACPCCKDGVTLEGKECTECYGKGLVCIAYERLRVQLKLIEFAEFQKKFSTENSEVPK